MTELEQARAHLRICQTELHAARSLAWCIAGQRAAGLRERAVLAALSWVYDAQERAAGPFVLTVEDTPELRRRMEEFKYFRGDLITVEARPYADRFYRSPRRPTRRAVAPASRGRRRRS